MAQSVQVKAVSWQHEAMADLMIAEPHLSLTEISKRLGFSIGWLSVVKNSDSFKDYFAIRRKLHSDSLTTGIKEKAAAIAELSMEVILTDMETKIGVGTLSSAEARENLDLVARRFGFDGTVGQQKNTQQVTLNVGMVTSEALAEARERMRALSPVPLLEDKT